MVTGSEAPRIRRDVDHGRTGEKVDWPDPAAAPLGTDEEAGSVGPAKGIHRSKSAPAALDRGREPLNGEGPIPNIGVSWFNDNYGPILIWGGFAFLLIAFLLLEGAS